MCRQDGSVLLMARVPLLPLVIEAEVNNSNLTLFLNGWK